MSATFTLNAELRTDTGKGASRRLRHANRVPAIIYGSDKEPAMLTLRHDDIFHASDDEAFFSHILTIEYDGKSEQVIIKDMQRHPARIQIMHADFQRIDADHALHVNVPIHFLNEESSLGVKAGGIVSHEMTELEVSCLPKDLPEYIEVDMANLDVGDSIHLTSIVLPEGVSSVILMQGDDHDQAVAAIHMPRGEKLDEEVAVEGEGEEEGTEEE
ncbi:MAG: 50S ribosomal protein L25/general stress protein Ctc [gamma proteobacterium symbiont of Bathyaustriella thionipta]|nr:50S ribosomal protein L25/general stress protein Ctc [gamma proteobacterium symbiont of Bathyaustriella thionipta]MCU7950372.1 50S ribosomal protein L25/general stress protein Ctc [gamma proteobacterium symbiont of Bathyaustriella thionipta]MCU7954656.1 50S ribosomal protein L25/general stress protein Ctc [gamma proteobacterium symbiont of Bathyaustriella thionipta]MCU7956877.1 50S ribosomal protein L25/general stress protein Ctc [gamma proteobacterium symbiont of Bathyaustriella thionipta]M